MPLFKVCLRYAQTREEAEDVLQEGFLKIFRDISQFDREKASFYTWAKRVVINTALENIRKRESRPRLGELNGEVKFLTYDMDVISQLSVQEMIAHINKLPGGYRAVFNMYVIDGYNHREIAEKLDISENTSKTQLYKARNRLAAMLKKERINYNIV